MAEEGKAKAKKAKAPEEFSGCPATAKMLGVAQRLDIETAFERSERIKPCPIGKDGGCCKHCSMGPCRVSAPKKEETPEEKKKRTGVCGATPSTIAARNFIRMVAGGAAAHSDHGRGVAETFLAAAKGETEDYKIKDTKKLMEVAQNFGIETEGREVKEIAVELGEQALAQWGQQQGEVVYCKAAPKKRYELWKKLGVVPRGIDREIVEIMHRTHIGVDQDYKNLIFQGTRAAIADGWGGSMYATELQDILFGCPIPIKSKMNLGVFEEDKVNVVIHGHEPLLSEMIVAAANDPEIIEYAKSKGATGISLSGICCTANELLMRHGIPICGNFLQQELAIVTGAVEAMVVDVQCIMQAITETAKCFHTKIITTNYRAKMQEGATHIQFEEHHAMENAKQILRAAIDNFPNRDASKVCIPKGEYAEVVAGFSYEAIRYMLGGTFRESFRPLNDNIINGRIRGVAGVVG
jgi:carbon-monoxide dehydrogenase catalytic subunit